MSNIIQLLAQRHSKDVFVPECKNGPSQSGSHVRLDAWAMAKSWAHPLISGYEMKVSRADFAKDNKWHKYLPLCNQLFFVCPSGLLKPEEIPAEVGLIWASENRLTTKRKAAHREVEFPEQLFRYILMCRAKIGDEFDPNDRTSYRRDFWVKWLEQKTVDRELGYQVGRELQRTIREKIHAVEERQEQLEKRLSKYEDVRQMLRRLDINEDYFSTYSVESQMQNLRKIAPPEFENTLKHLIRQAQEMQELINPKPKE